MSGMQHSESGKPGLSFLNLAHFFFQMFPDNAVKREMSILVVQCINPGCTWQGKFRHYEVNTSWQLIILDNTLRCQLGHYTSMSTF